MNSVDRLLNIRPHQQPEHLISPSQLVRATIGFIKRRILIIGAAVGCMLLLGIVYIVNAPPVYTAQTRILIDKPQAQILQPQSPFMDMALDVGTIESQVELLRSETIANKVAQQLKLQTDPEFTTGTASPLGSLKRKIFGYFSTPEPLSETTLNRAAVGTVRGNTRVYRVGLTYVIAIEYSSIDPRRAAEVADTIANVYIADQLSAKFDAAQRASVWMQQRITELREQASTAERMVVEYKTKNNIVEDGGGRLLDRQQLAEINTQLILARSQTAEARARLNRVRQILESGVSGATVTDQLRSDVVNALRSRYLDVVARESDWSRRFGRDHLAAVNARNQIREIEISIQSELKRLEEVYTSDLDIARKREEDMQANLEKAVSLSQDSNEAQVTLNELQSSAQSLRTLYDTFLRRYMETIQQQSFPISDARVISRAEPPAGPSQPKKKLILLGSIFAGLMLGLGLGAARDLADQAFRSPEEIENDLHLDCLAIVPKALDQDGVKKTSRRNKPGEFQIASGGTPAWTVVEKPFSRFAEAIRSMKLSVDSTPHSSGARVIGITSSLPGEGKSTLSTALALLIAQTGAKTLLVDGDLRNPTLTRTLSRKTRSGILDVLKDATKLKEVMWSDSETGLSFLPCYSSSPLSHSSDVFASEKVSELFHALRAEYQYIIVDLSPLAPVVDVRATYRLIDSYLFVVEWGKTKREVAKYALEATPGLRDKLVGAVLSKADLRAMSRYDSNVKDYFFGKSYKSYGYTD